MNYSNILKISVILILLLMAVGSVNALDTNQDDVFYDDMELDEDFIDFDEDYDDSDFDDEDLDDDLDDSDFDDEDLDDDLDSDDDGDDDLDDSDLDDDLDSDDNWDDDFDDWDLDDDLDSDDDWDDDFDDWDWDDDLDFDDDWDDDSDDVTDAYYYFDFYYLKFKTLSYLSKYGNYSIDDFDEDDEFLNESQIFILNQSNYTLNESAEGYETYLKIFDSITSTFEDYFLYENEVDSLKIIIIYYLNNYGNVCADYAWNESESFENYDPYKLTDFEYLKFKIDCYLYQYGNNSDYWIESEEFLNEYQIYLLNPSNYTLNESAEGYETYLKIFDSITSTFSDYNLTENETAYLKFMIIFYLNHYGNVSANYTWNEYESFANFTPFIINICGAPDNIAKVSLSDYNHNYYSNFHYIVYNTLNNSTDVNQTAFGNIGSIEFQYSWNSDIFLLLVMIFLVILIIL